MNEEKHNFPSEGSEEQRRDEGSHNEPPSSWAAGKTMRATLKARRQRTKGSWIR